MSNQTIIAQKKSHRNNIKNDTKYDTFSPFVNEKNGT